MTQVEGASESSQVAPGSRQESYLLWRRRLAAKQAAIRTIGSEDPRPPSDPAWSPDALFRTDDGSAINQPERPASSLGEQLQELNRLRLEGTLDDEEFNRRKAALFARRPTSNRPSVDRPPDLERGAP